MNVKFLGIEEIEMVCQFCGKKEIGRAFCFLDLETGNVIRFGSQCAKKALGFSTNSKMGKKLRADIESTFQADCMASRKAIGYNKAVEYEIYQKSQRALDVIRSAGF
jgi:hypothetical protein